MSDDWRAVYVDTSKGGYCRTRAVTQYDYGQYLKFSDIFDLTKPFEVYFSHSLTGTAMTMIGDYNKVDIPNEMLTTGRDIFAWLFLHQGSEDGETKFEIRIPVLRRSRDDGGGATPEQQSALTRAMALLSDSTEKSEASAERAEDAATRAEDAAAQTVEVKTQLDEHIADQIVHLNEADREIMDSIPDIKGIGNVKLMEIFNDWL